MRRLFPDVPARKGLTWIAVLLAAQTLSAVVLLPVLSGTRVWLMAGTAALSGVSAVLFWRVARSHGGSARLGLWAIAALVVDSLYGLLLTVLVYHSDPFTLVIAVALVGLVVVWAMQCVRRLSESSTEV